MKKSIILAILLLTQTIITMADSGTITNNSNNPVNVIFYDGAWTAITTGAGNTLGISSKGRIGHQGTLIPGGQNINFPPGGIKSIDVHYGNGTLAPLHAPVEPNNSYTINPGVTWSVTIDK